MPAYEDVVKADLSTLLDASSMWKQMGERFGELHTDYKDNVAALTAENGPWTGVGASAFTERSRATLHEFDGAKIQAKAIGGLLDNAYHRLSVLQKKVAGLRDAAVESRMTVDGNGVCRYDFSRYSPEEARAIAHDLGRADVEHEWTEKLRKAVHAVSEADHEVRVALQTATRDRDGKGDLDGFNGAALSSIDGNIVVRLLGRDDLSAGERKRVRAEWRSCTPEARAQLWLDRKDQLIEAGIMTPRYDWKPADPGAGPHGTKDPALREWWILAQARAMVAGGAFTGKPDAAAHMAHYLGNTGDTVNLDVDRMMRDDEVLKGLTMADIAEHQHEWKQQALEEFRESGGKPVTIPVETQAQGITVEDENWYYAAGSVMTNTSGVVMVTPDANGKPEVSLDYQVNVYDRYNWDPGKQTQVGPTTVTDADMARLHQTGIAQEFNMEGHSAAQQKSL